MTAQVLALRELASSIVQNAVPRSAAELNGEIEALSQRLRELQCRRIALCTPRADIVAVTLCACARAQVEVLLLRRLSATDLLVGWEVDTLLNEDFSCSKISQPELASREFGVLLSTSGTTGVPKIALHSIDRLLGRIQAPPAAGLQAVWLLSYHPASFAGLQVLLTSLCTEGKLVANSALTVTELASVAQQFGVTHISATPTFWRAFLMVLGAACARLPLKQATLGGERVDQAILDRIATLFPTARIVHIYASTEAGALFAVRDGKTGFPAQWLSEPIDGVRLRIHDGTLQVKSPRAMHGYLPGTGRDPTTTDGWIDTNDRVDLRGERVEFVGRRDSIINVGGANVSPEEVEAVLLKADGILDAMVMGMKNPISGEVVRADIVVQPGLDVDTIKLNMLSLARRELQPYQIPRIVRVVEAIKYSQSGKKERK